MRKACCSSCGASATPPAIPNASVAHRTAATQDPRQNQWPLRKCSKSARQNSLLKIRVSIQDNLKFVCCFEVFGHDFRHFRTVSPEALPLRSPSIQTQNSTTIHTCVKDVSKEDKRLCLHRFPAPASVPASFHFLTSPPSTTPPLPLYPVSQPRKRRAKHLATHRHEKEQKLELCSE